MASIREGGHESVELRLASGHTLRGRVRTPAGGPVSGVRVLVMEQSPDATSARGALTGTETDESGRFTLVGLPSGAVIVKVLGSAGDQSQSITLGSEPDVEIGFVLEPPVGVDGIVLSSKGQPAAGAQVMARSLAGDGRGTLARATADGEGRFAISGLGAGQVDLVVWTAADAGFVEPFAAAAGSVNSLRIELEPGATVSGTVRWDHGEPAAAVLVHGAGWAPDLDSGQSSRYRLHPDHVRTDDQGRFTIGPFLTGEAALVAIGPDDKSVRFTSRNRLNQRRVPVTAGQVTTGVALVLTSGRYRLTGRVSGPDGLPLAGCAVSAELEDQGIAGRSRESPQALTGTDGTFAIPATFGGVYTVWVSHPDHEEMERRHVPADVRSVELRLRQISR